MDDFEKDLFESDNDSLPLENNGEKIEDNETETVTATDDHSSQSDTISGTDAVYTSSPADIFSHSETAEAAFPQKSDFASEKIENSGSVTDPYADTLQTTESSGQKPQSPVFTQNPYRNPYQQSGNYRGTYSGAAAQGSGASSKPQNNPGYAGPEKPTSGSSTGKKIAAALLAIVMLIGSVGIGIAIGRGNKTPIDREPQTTDSVFGTSAQNEQTTGESVNFTISGTEQATLGNSVSPGIQVAKKARGSVIGVVVYDVNGKLHGEGSGVVMGLNEAKTETYIITCAHVISDAAIKSCGIMLESGKVEPAKIVGYDDRTDIGVLSVSLTNLQPASFGDSTALQVGETVYAIGNPGGSEFYGSMTSGIVSALDRSISSTYTMTVIQHNAAISPGNSGGALVNSEGQVIGINSSKISATDYEGIGFAVPVSVAYPVVESLIKYGYVPNRPKLGISYASVSNYWRYSAIVQSKGLPAGSVIIASIADDSAFKGTSVNVGDMITSVNGQKLTKSGVLLDIVDKSKVGDTLKLGICRIERSSTGGSYTINQFEVNVTLVEDKGSASAKDQEETTTQSFYDYYYGNGAAGDNNSSFEDFFSQFFGSGF